MTYDQWKATDPHESYEAPEIELTLVEDATMVALEYDAKPITNMNDITDRLKRAERYRMALAEVYRYVDELDENAREAGDTGASQIEIIDEVKRLISRVHS